MNGKKLRTNIIYIKEFDDLKIIKRFYESIRTN
jgi:hypothetical protein